MKKLITLTKTLLVLAGLCVGVNAWAYDTPDGYEVREVLLGKLSNGTVSALTFDEDGDAVPSFTNKGGFSIVSELPTTWNSLTTHMSGNALRIGSRSTHEMDFASVVTKGQVVFSTVFYQGTHAKVIKFIDESDKVIAYFSFSDKSSSNGRVYNQPYLYIGDDYAEGSSITGGYALADTYLGTRDREYDITDFVIDLDAKTITYTGKVMDRRKVNNVTNNYYDQCVDNATITIGSEFKVKGIIIDASGVGSNTYYGYFDNMKLYRLGLASGNVNYTINYQYQGVTIASENGTEAVGETVNASNTSVWNEGGTQKYFVADGATTSMVLADGENVLNIPLRLAENYSYTVNAVKNEERTYTIKEIATGTVIEGESVTVPYPHYLNVNGTLYSRGVTSKEYRQVVTPTQNAFVQQLYYTASETVTNLVYLSEAEDIPGVSSYTTGNVPIRASMATTATHSGNLTIVKLPAGTYTLTAGLFRTGSTDLTSTFTIGGNVISLTTTNGNLNEKVGSEFTIASAQDVVWDGGGNLDYLYITGTPTNEIVGTLDYSTTANGAISSNYVLKQGETKVFTFQNHGQDFGKNWRINVKEGETWKANVRADSWDEVAQAATKVAYQVSKDGGSSKVNLDWNEFQADMADARVVATLAYGTDGTLSITTTSTGAANGYIYYVDQDVTGLTGDLTINLSVNESWLEVISVEPVISVTIGAAGYATLCPAVNLNFENATNIEARTAKVDATTGAITYSKVNTVAAGEGVVLASLTGEAVEENIPVISSATANENNDLVGIPEKVKLEQTSGDYTNYVLAIVNDEIGFYKVNTNGTWCKAGSAYLKVATSTPTARGFFPMWDDATGINDVKNLKSELNGEVYNLNGQRVNNPTKGLYIVNGKKVVLN